MEPRLIGRPPWAPRWWLRLASWIAPAMRRMDWLAAWRARLQAWWVLSERGEMPSDAEGQGSLLCRTALAEAFWLRFSREHWRSVLRGPAITCSVSVLAFAGLSFMSRGFAVTRLLAHTWRTRVYTSPTSGYDPASDRLMGYLAPIVVALFIGAVMAFIEGIPAERQHWKYWLFLSWKAAATAILLPLVWIEGGAILRAHIPYEGPRILLGGVCYAVAFIGSFGYAIHWVLLDQRQRCPVCLQRLTLPVRIGSWASVFDPATTEMVCEAGHGTLTVAEIGNSELDHWNELDESWRGLFQPVH